MKQPPSFWRLKAFASLSPSPVSGSELFEQQSPAPNIFGAQAVDRYLIVDGVRNKRREGRRNRNAALKPSLDATGFARHMQAYSAGKFRR
ncbi:hypothetical protein [Paraburkholderia unamae]|uniref:Uncharacterized protein n=1 Tax=Paraburkholderia unamae TaxID=219649 RepID=A0ACC6RSN9_9BURK